MHGLLRENAEVKDAIVARLGKRVLGRDDEIDRARVAQIVFADREALRWLEGLLHPRVVTSYLSWREELARRDDPPALAVTEGPLLYEVGGETRFDAVVAVTAPAATREKRLGRPVTEREERLLPDAEKLARADFAYVNDGSLEDLDRFVSDVAAKLTRAVD